MSKIDLRKELKPLYSASASKAALINVPKLKFLMVDGAGHPEANPAFQHAMEALFGVAYTLKFASKLGPSKKDWTVMPPEGLLWMKGNRKFTPEHKDDWRWTLMILQPDFVTARMVREAKAQVKEKKDSPAVDELRLASFREGPAVQIMHIGPYSEVGPAIDKLGQFAAGQGYALTGKHHEIYCSDPRRAAPEKLKTIVRQPVKKKR